MICKREGDGTPRGAWAVALSALGLLFNSSGCTIAGGIAILAAGIGPCSFAAADVRLSAAVGDLQSEDPRVRQQAAVRLGRLADRDATAALARALSDTHGSVRREAAKALGFINDRRATLPLADALRDADQNVRFYAAYALGEIKDTRATESLLKALDDQEWSVRDQAAWALREIGDERLIGRLVEMLDRKETDVACVVWILRQLERAEVVARLSSGLESSSAQTRQRVVQALGALQDPHVVTPLLAALQDRAPDVRRQAIERLAELRNARAVEPLMKMAAQDPDATVRRTAELSVARFSRDGDLMAHWDFEDVRSAVAMDRTGNGNDGQVIGCAAVEGRLGRALEFGPGRYVEIGKPADIPIALVPFTVSAWVRTAVQEGVIVARGGAFCGFSLYVKDGVPKFGIHRTQEGPGFIAEGSEQMSRGWTHVLGVVEQECIELFVNGELRATTPTTGLIPSNCGQGMEIGFDAGDRAAEIVTPFEGVIDEVRVYRVALSAEEVAREYRRDLDKVGGQNTSEK